MSVVVGEFLVSFGNFGVVSEAISPQKQALECYFQGEEFLGEYYGMIMT